MVQREGDSYSEAMIKCVCVCVVVVLSLCLSHSTFTYSIFSLSFNYTRFYSLYNELNPMHKHHQHLYSAHKLNRLPPTYICIVYKCTCLNVKCFHILNFFQTLFYLYLFLRNRGSIVLMYTNFAILLIFNMFLKSSFELYEPCINSNL